MQLMPFQCRSLADKSVCSQQIGHIVSQFKEELYSSLFYIINHSHPPLLTHC